MKTDQSPFLKHILDAIKKIEKYTRGIDEDAFKKNDLVQDGVIRQIEIIGEAMDRILKMNPEFPLSESRKIVDTRNRIIHGYDSVSADIIWLIVNKHLPVLEKQIKEFLKG